MTTIVLALSAFAAAASVASLAVVLWVALEVRKLRRRNIQRYALDANLGVSTSRPEDMQTYRNSISAIPDLPQEVRAAAIKEWKLSE